MSLQDPPELVDSDKQQAGTALQKHANSLITPGACSMIHPANEKHVTTSCLNASHCQTYIFGLVSTRLQLMMQFPTTRARQQTARKRQKRSRVKTYFCMRPFSLPRFTHQDKLSKKKKIPAAKASPLTPSCLSYLGRQNEKKEKWGKKEQI